MSREHLAEAAAKRSSDALQRTLDALQRMRRTGMPVSFVAVAREAGVSTDFLYSRPALRSRIEALRTQRPTPNAPAPSPGNDPDAGDAPMTALAGRMKRTKEHYEAEIQRLNAALAVAHGENLALRRRLAASGHHVDPSEQ
ncbi:DUF6262 family protein [Cellulomonas endometrii]|uniref:DUF6262 family protein n=1 Tax=Cellulomonas endometrii TaxID=3036301 RepID=UPI0024AE196C|nr:DUF6262 family protein [Cellulomonas endometrii]